VPVQVGDRSELMPIFKPKMRTMLVIYFYGGIACVLNDVNAGMKIVVDI
jgi:hypothetical protein